MKGDVVGTAAISDDVTAPTDLDDTPIPVTSQTTGARPAEQEHLRGTIRMPLGRFERENEVVGDDGWHSGPRATDRRREPFPIAPRDSAFDL